MRAQKKLYWESSFKVCTSNLSIKPWKYASNSVHFWLSAKPPCSEEHTESDHLRSETEKKEQIELLGVVKEEDLYSLTVENIYDTVDTKNIYSPNLDIQNRPPAPIPRPEPEPEPEQPVICRGVATIFDFSAQKYMTIFFFTVFLDKGTSNRGQETDQLACAGKRGS